MMVGLSIVLEAQKGSSISKKTPKVINKTMMLRNITKHTPSTFLDLCFLCRKKLLPGKDIYMYKGNMAFCSVECRCQQIFMDEEGTIQKENCSFAAMKHKPSSSSSSINT